MFFRGTFIAKKTAKKFPFKAHSKDLGGNFWVMNLFLDYEVKLIIRQLVICCNLEKQVVSRFAVTAVESPTFPIETKLHLLAKMFSINDS